MSERNGKHSQNGRTPLAPATIGFRLDLEARSILARRAESLGVSPHDLARHYVLECLHSDEDRAALREAIVELRKEMIEARQDVTLSTEALLASAGKASPAEASSWTRENLGPK